MMQPMHSAPPQTVLVEQPIYYEEQPQYVEVQQTEYIEQPVQYI